MRTNRPVYSLLIPICDEEDTLRELNRQLRDLLDRLDGPTEVVLVDDGSRDRSYEIMLGINRQDPRFKVIRFSRNFGHQAAISAAMDFADGEAVVIMDADLQDPPDVVLELAARWREGYEVVYGIRDERIGETRFKLLTASWFYRLLRRLTDLDIPMNAGDFRLVDRKALDAFKALREHSRYVRGMFSWVGFKQTGVRYKRAARFAGETKYPLGKMLKLATDGILSFSIIPLRLALNAGLLIALASFLGGLTAIIMKLSGSYVVQGWVSLVVIVSFLGGIQLMVTGILGEYIGRIYEEVKNRPLYVVSRLHGFSHETRVGVLGFVSDNPGDGEGVRTEEA
jgi:polyisoprenyl-phosphate glycosyltransferase